MTSPAEAPWPPALEALAELLGDSRAPISRASRARLRDVHVRDSLAGLELEPLSSAQRIGDLGSGAGLPGLVLAAVMPRARVDLIESSTRKCAFLREALERTGLSNAAVVCERSEEWSAPDRGTDGGREAYDAVCARALGGLAELAELASPLLREGGWLLAWRGARDADDERAVGSAATRTAVEPVEVRAVTPYEGSRDRHIHLLRKNGPTPNQLPRRPGMAAKRPFGPE